MPIRPFRYDNYRLGVGNSYDTDAGVDQLRNVFGQIRDELNVVVVPDVATPDNLNHYKNMLFDLLMVAGAISASPGQNGSEEAKIAYKYIQAFFGPEALLPEPDNENAADRQERLLLNKLSGLNRKDQSVNGPAIRKQIFNGDVLAQFNNGNLTNYLFPYQDPINAFHQRVHNEFNPEAVPGTQSGMQNNYVFYAPKNEGMLGGAFIIDKHDFAGTRLVVKDPEASFMEQGVAKAIREKLASDLVRCFLGDEYAPETSVLYYNNQINPALAGHNLFFLSKFLEGVESVAGNDAVSKAEKQEELTQLYQDEPSFYKCAAVAIASANHDFNRGNLLRKGDRAAMIDNGEGLAFGNNGANFRDEQARILEPIRRACAETNYDPNLFLNDQFIIEFDGVIQQMVDNRAVVAEQMRQSMEQISGQLARFPDQQRQQAWGTFLADIGLTEWVPEENFSDTLMDILDNRIVDLQQLSSILKIKRAFEVGDLNRIQVLHNQGILELPVITWLDKNVDTSVVTTYQERTLDLLGGFLTNLPPIAPAGWQAGHVNGARNDRGFFGAARRGEGVVAINENQNDPLLPNTTIPFAEFMGRQAQVPAPAPAPAQAANQAVLQRGGGAQAQFGQLPYIGQAGVINNIQQANAPGSQRTKKVLPEDKQLSTGQKVGAVGAGGGGLFAGILVAALINPYVGGFIIAAMLVVGVAAIAARKHYENKHKVEVPVSPTSKDSYGLGKGQYVPTPGMHAAQEVTRRALREQAQHYNGRGGAPAA